MGSEAVNHPAYLLDPLTFVYLSPLYLFTTKTLSSQRNLIKIAQLSSFVPFVSSWLIPSDAVRANAPQSKFQRFGLKARIRRRSLHKLLRVLHLDIDRLPHFGQIAETLPGGIPINWARPVSQM